MHKRRFLAGLFCTLVVTATAFAQSASCTFTYFDLSTTPFPGGTFAQGINRYGTVVGSGCGQDTPDACLDNRGLIRFTDGTHKVLLAPNSTDTWFSKRNASGVTVGESVGTQGHHHGIVYYNGTWRRVDYPGAYGTAVTGINKYGTMVGKWTDSKGNVHGFKLADGQFTRIDFPGAVQTFPSAISDTGVIVGTYYSPFTADIYVHGFVLRSGVYTRTDDQNQTTSLSDINASGTIVGNQDGRPFIIKNGTFYDVVAPGANATSVNGINGYGTITGTAFFGLESRPFTATCTF